MMSTARSSRATRLVSGTAAAVVLLCACSAGSRQSPDATITPPPLDGAHPPASLAAALSALPLAADELSAAQWQTIKRAVGILQVKCMNRHGYHGSTPTPTARSAATFPGGGGPFGFVNAGYAARRGFGPPGHARSKGMNLTEARTSMACLRPAQDKVFRPLATTGSTVLGTLDLKSVHDAGADKRVVAATRAWATCMKADGFEDSNPLSLAREHWPAVPSARELATAKADAACTRATDLAGIYFAALAGYQRELAAPHPKALASARKADESLAARAAKILDRQAKKG